MDKSKLNVTKIKPMALTAKYKYNYCNINTINLQIQIVSRVKYLGFQLGNFFEFQHAF